MRRTGIRAPWRATALAAVGIGAGGCMFFADYDDLGARSESEDLADGGVGDADAGRRAKDDWCGDAVLCDDFERDADVQGAWTSIGAQASGKLRIDDGIGTGKALTVQGALAAGDAWLAYQHDDDPAIAGVRLTVTLLLDDWPSQDTYVLGARFGEQTVALVAGSGALAIAAPNSAATVAAPLLHTPTRVRLEVTRTTWSFDVLSPLPSHLAGPFDSGSSRGVHVTLGDRIENHGATWTSKLDRAVVELTMLASDDAGHQAFLAPTDPPPRAGFEE